MVLHCYQGALSHMQSKHIPQAESLNGSLTLVVVYQKPVELMQGSFHGSQNVQGVFLLCEERGWGSQVTKSILIGTLERGVSYDMLYSTAKQAASGEPVLEQGSEEDESSREPCVWKMCRSGGGLSSRSEAHALD